MELVLCSGPPSWLRLQIVRGYRLQLLGRICEEVGHEVRAAICKTISQNVLAHTLQTLARVCNRVCP